MITKKRKTKQFTLADAEILLKKIEKETRKAIKGNLTDNWRDNLFDIIMTRMEIANKYKKEYIQINKALKREPQAACGFARELFNTMHNILFMAKAPDRYIHIASLTILYLTVVNVFLKDNEKDLNKTMAALDKNLGYFEELSLLFCGKK